MNIRLNDAQEAKIAELASTQGRAVEDVVRDLVNDGLRTEEYYRAKLERSVAQADRGDFIDETEMEVRFQAMMQRP
jgi:predicted transcriptional regulator